MKRNTDLRYLELHTYVILYIDADVPEGVDLTEKFSESRLGLMIPAQFGLALRWGFGVRQVHQDLMAVRSFRVEHVVIHLNILLFDLYLKQDVRMFMEMVTSGLNWTQPHLHDVMRRQYFNRLRRVDIILDMRHDKLSHELCTRYTPISVDPVVQELFKPWCERGIVKLSKIFRLPKE